MGDTFGLNLGLKCAVVLEDRVGRGAGASFEAEMKWRSPFGPGRGQQTFVARCFP